MYLLLTPMVKLSSRGLAPTEYTVGYLASDDDIRHFKRSNYFCGLLIDTETKDLYELEDSNLRKVTITHIITKYHMSYVDSISFNYILTSDISLLVSYPTIDPCTDIDEVLHTLWLARLKGDI